MRYWMNNERDKEPEIFDAEVKRVCEHYTDALGLYEKGAHLLSTDEKSSIQALERLHPCSFRCEQAPLSARSTSISATAQGVCSPTSRWPRARS
jgi:hypothetical protein